MNDNEDIEVNGITSQDLVEFRPKGKYGDTRTYKDLEGFLGISGVLQGEAAKRSLEARKRFLDLLAYPEFHVMSEGEKADAIGISLKTLSKWEIQVPDEYLADALRKSRERSARQSFKVDAALMKECLAGNVKALDLYYRRIEGWVPKQDMELSRGRDKDLDARANFDLLKELVKGLSPEDRAELLSAGQGGGVLEAKGDSSGVEGGRE